MRVANSDNSMRLRVRCEQQSRTAWHQRSVGVFARGQTRLDEQMEQEGLSGKDQPIGEVSASKVNILLTRQLRPGREYQRAYAQLDCQERAYSILLTAGYLTSPTGWFVQRGRKIFVPWQQAVQVPLPFLDTHFPFVLCEPSKAAEKERSREGEPRRNCLSSSLSYLLCLPSSLCLLSSIINRH